MFFFCCVCVFFLKNSFRDFMDGLDFDVLLGVDRINILPCTYHMLLPLEEKPHFTPIGIATGLYFVHLLHIGSFGGVGFVQL